MNTLGDIITYVRRIVKTPSNAVLSDNLIIDYINRFYIMDVDARIQLFDLKTKYQFQTAPGVDRYNMPLYSLQTQQGSQDIGMYPVYQGFASPAYINGIQVPLQTQKTSFFNSFPNVVQNLQVVGVGDGTDTYNLTVPITPNSTVPSNPPFNSLLRGHIDISGIIALDDGNVDPPFYTSTQAVDTGPVLGSLKRCPVTSVDAAIFITSIDEFGNNVVVSDSGQFLMVGTDKQANYGLLMTPGSAPNGNAELLGGYSTTSNTVNYQTGEINVRFPVNIPAGNNINVQCYYFQSGLPRGILFNNNTLTLRAPPATQYLVELDAYISPAAFLSSAAALPFGYMAEYIARGAARKILSDTGDWDQYDRYEPQFKEQEILVWKRSQRQVTNNRTETIYSSRAGGSNSSMGGGIL